MKSITQQLFSKYSASIVIILCYLQTKESFASEDHSCPQMTLPHMRNTSLWSEFVRSADFINVDESEAIQELVSQTAELKAIFNHFKELYVSYSCYFINLSLWQTKNHSAGSKLL